MKKFVTIIVALALTLSLAGCGTPPEIYAEAVENYQKATGVICSFNTSITLMEDGSSYGSSAAGKLLINNGEVRTASMTGSAILNPASGEQLSVSISAYYDGSKYYGGLQGGGVCYNADWQEFLAQAGQYGFAENLTETDFEGILSEETETGEIITYVVPATVAANWVGISDLWQQTAGTTGTAVITAVQGVLTLDEDRNPVKQELEVTGTIASGSDSIQITQKITTEISLSEETVGVASPVASGYTEITK